MPPNGCGRMTRADQARAAILALLDAETRATTGRWFISQSRSPMRRHIFVTNDPDPDSDGSRTLGIVTAPDASFIVATRNHARSWLGGDLATLDRHGCAYAPAWCLRCEDTWPCPDVAAVLDRYAEAAT